MVVPIPVSVLVERNPSTWSCLNEPAPTVNVQRCSSRLIRVAGLPPVTSSVIVCTKLSDAVTFESAPVVAPKTTLSPAASLSVWALPVHAPAPFVRAATSWMMA